MKSDPDELERKLEQVRRLASLTDDQPTLQRLREFADELKQKLRSLISSRFRTQIRNRARKLWEQNGRPEGRDLEFWLQAEREIKEAGDLESSEDF